MARLHLEHHAIARVGWLRAAVLGANDGLVSTAALVVGVAASGATAEAVFVAGMAGLIAGAMSMAAGEYVSVSSQHDTEQADLARERRELAEMPEHELKELAGIFEKRGLTPDLAQQVAQQLTAHDALAAHAREELGITEQLSARPLQAAFASALAFAAGAILPLLALWLAPVGHIALTVTIVTLILLAGLGSLGAWLGRAPLMTGLMRVLFWGAAALGMTALIGKLVGAVV